MSARATRVSAPGAARLTLNGIVAVPDDFGRLRLQLLIEGPTGYPDSSLPRLQRAVATFGQRFEGPFTLDADGSAMVWIVAPAHRRAFWLERAAELRGTWASAEVTLRGFARPRSSHG